MVSKQLWHTLASPFGRRKSWKTWSWNCHHEFISSLLERGKLKCPGAEGWTHKWVSVVMWWEHRKQLRQRKPGETMGKSKWEVQQLEFKYKEYSYTSDILQVWLQTTTIKWELWLSSRWHFLFSSAYKSYVCATLQSVKCTIALCLKKQHTYLN